MFSSKHGSNLACFQNTTSYYLTIMNFYIPSCIFSALTGADPVKSWKKKIECWCCQCTSRYRRLWVCEIIKRKRFKLR